MEPLEESFGGVVDVLEGGGGVYCGAGVAVGGEVRGKLGGDLEGVVCSVVVGRKVSYFVSV